MMMAVWPKALVMGGDRAPENVANRRLGNGMVHACHPFQHYRSTSAILKRIQSSNDLFLILTGFLGTQATLYLFPMITIHQYSTYLPKVPEGA